jgi:hypothetical protein
MTDTGSHRKELEAWVANERGATLNYGCVSEAGQGSEWRAEVTLQLGFEPSTVEIVGVASTLDTACQRAIEAIAHYGASAEG